MGEDAKAMLAKPIQLADQVAKQAGWQCLRTECTELRSRAEKLATLLRQAARADLYERPAARVISATTQALNKAAGMAARCFQSHSRLRRFFTLNPVSGVPRTLALLDTALEDVAWLIRVSSPIDDDGDLRGMPNIAQNEPVLGLVWDHIARLQTGTLAARADAAATLASLARDSPHFAKYIIEEDGVGPLVRLLKDGADVAREAAVTALGLLARDEESVEKLLPFGICSVLATALKEPPLRVQAAAAEAVAALAHHSRKCQDLFSQTNAVRHLFGHLASGIIQEHAKYSVGIGGNGSRGAPPPEQRMTSLHSVVLAKSHSVRQGDPANSSSQPLNGQQQTGKNENQKQSAVQSGIAANTATNGVVAAPATARSSQMRPNGSSGRGWREAAEDPATKAQMKAMAAKALWKLARGHVGVCRSITESRALLCFARLLESSDGDGNTPLRFYSAMAIMEITRVAEHTLALRQSAFKPSSPAAKTVVEQILRVVRNGDDDDMLRPCVTALGCLSRTFTASETRVINPLVRLLDDRDVPVIREAMVALTKFACTENHLHVNHCKAIVDAGGARHLVQLVYLGEQMQVEALILLCYIAQHVAESEELAQAGVLAVLLWASKQVHMVQDTRVEKLLPDARARLELFQSRASR
jgi:DNA-binding FrmR family transcriptional regulator